MLTLDEAVEKARALESAKNQSASYASELTLNASSLMILRIHLKIPRRPSNSTFKNQKLYFCGRQRHTNRRQCPALNDTCERCQKTGHWQVVCKSPKTVNTKAHPSSAALIAALAVLDEATVPVQVNRTSTFALIDTGSSETFISQCFADNSHFELLGHHYAKTKLSVLPDLCANIIVGHDFLKQHSELRVSFGGTKPPLTISYLAPAKIEPPPLFELLTKDVKPIVTKSRKHSLEDSDFMRKEIEKLLADEIIEERRSPWRAQAFVVKSDNHKKRMVIDYSQATNRYTHLDAYPLPNLEEIVSKVW
ncbi:uncharacterized protein [Halyomorpha halys]|uniref:uncharacterized protein n=1 Tax=Halyomorpha halys TaxID=286706 RepID=UPI0006D4EFCB|nr:uncharacterized protein LOC106692606 [Halyomorpha halys]